MELVTRITQRGIVMAADVVDHEAAATRQDPEIAKTGKDYNYDEVV
ncbi:MAG: hypothetical protein ACR2OL_02660 [Anderseniella sp.]